MIGATAALMKTRLTASVIQTAVIGLGWWGRKIVADLGESSQVNVILAVDPEEKARLAISRMGVETAADFEAAIKHPDVEAVILCSPHKFHAEQIIAAAGAGKHVFCEKPFSTTGAETDSAIAAAEAAGIQLGIGHERRFEPAILELQHRCRTEDLGRPLVFEGNFSQDKFLDLPPDNWRLSNVDAPVGPLSATGIHLVDLAISIFGRPTDVWARLSTQATTFANGDTLTVTLGFAEGRTALITAVLTTPFFGRVQVLGSAGWMEIRDRNHPEDPKGWDVTVTHREASETRFFAPHNSVRENIERFAAAVEGTGVYPVTMEEISANAWTFEAISKSAASGNIEPVHQGR